MKVANRMRYFYALALIFIVLVLPCIAMSACSSAEKTSTSISKQADNFETPRKITVVNTRTDTIIFELVGTFSIQHTDDELDIICATGNEQYEKHFIGINDGVIYIVEDLSHKDVDKYYISIKYYPE